MKILYVINRLGVGGAEKLIVETLPEINKKDDIEVNVLLLTDNKNFFGKELKDNGINVDVIPLKSLYSPINVYYLRRYIVDKKYDIVHVHLFPASYWVSIASKFIYRNKPKFILTEHSTHNKRREKRYLRHVEKFIYSSYDKVISISERTQNNLVSWLSPKQKNLNRFTIIENGVDINKFKNAKPYKKVEICDKLTEDMKLICMVGRFSEAKDQPTLIKAMKNISKEVHLLLIGEGPLKGKNEKLAKQLGIIDRVHFLGYRSDVERVLKTSDIIILSSYWEGLSLASIEAMASGRPFIASNVPGLKEIAGGHGLLFEAEDVNQLSELIIRLFNESSFYSSISKQCVKRSQNFTIDKMILKMIQLYENLIKL